jgi:hypothetical protein
VTAGNHQARHRATRSALALEPGHRLDRPEDTDEERLVFARQREFVLDAKPLQSPDEFLVALRRRASIGVPSMRLEEQIRHP